MNDPLNLKAIPDSERPAGLPSVAHAVEHVGGEEDGKVAGLIRSDEAALFLVIDPDGHVHMQSLMTEEDTYQTLRDITKAYGKHVQMARAEKIAEAN